MWMLGIVHLPFYLGHMIEKANTKTDAGWTFEG